MLFNTVLFTGNANPALAQEIATHLDVELGAASVGRFSDGEVTVEIRQNVRARQSASTLSLGSARLMHTDPRGRAARKMSDETPPVSQPSDSGSELKS